MTIQNARILVVDDVFENRDLLLRRLKRLGFAQIDEAADGVEALNLIASKAYDLVLLDIMMPVLDGFGVLEILKRDGRINELPVVVISAMNEIEPVVRCIELGAEDFIFKPFNPTLLRARVLATLEKKALRDLTREELKRKRAELNEARNLQLSLVPPRFEGTALGGTVSIDVVLEPAREVGGDLVDHFKIGGNLLVLTLGDVSDKGAGAALMMARTHTMFRALASRPDAAELFREPARAMDIVNAALVKGNATCMFVTFLLASLDMTTGHFAYVRAGHIPPFHLSAGGAVSRLTRQGGPPLGLVEDIAYKPDSITLSSGDQILVVTDGITEAHHPSGEFYGEQRIEEFLAGLEQKAEEPLAQLVGLVRAFEDGHPAFDDIAAILLTLDRS
jgi:sigma-B regulation protein RsbU (phosphoserine phosphatase)